MALKNFFMPSTIAILLVGCGGQPAGGFIEVDPDALADYWQCIRTGNFPTAGQKERLVARALDLAEQSGYFIHLNEEVEITGRAGVPVVIKISGQEVAIADNLYTPEEKILLGVAREVASLLN